MATRRKFDHRGYPREPHHMTDDVWYYVQKRGVIVCHRIRGEPGELTIIPWRKVARALDDHKKSKTRKAEA